MSPRGDVLHPPWVTVVNDMDLMHTASMGRTFNYTSSRMSSLGQYVVSAMYHCLPSIVENNLLDSTAPSEIKPQPKSYSIDYNYTDIRKSVSGTWSFE